MAELEKVTSKPKKKLASKIITKVDNTPADVLQYAQEGRELYFDGGKETFLELPTEVYKALSLDSKRRYDIEKNHFEGHDVVRDATPEAFDLPFNVRPEEPNRQLAVHGKKPEMDYHWARPDKMGYHQAEGWVVDHDPSVSTEYKESCSYKTVGGQSRPELVLMKRSKEVSAKKRESRKDLRDSQVKKTQGQFREAAEALGVKAVVDSTNS